MPDAAVGTAQPSPIAFAPDAPVHQVKPSEPQIDLAELEAALAHKPGLWERLKYALSSIPADIKASGGTPVVKLGPDQPNNPRLQGAKETLEALLTPEAIGTGLAAVAATKSPVIGEFAKTAVPVLFAAAATKSLAQQTGTLSGLPATPEYEEQREKLKGSIPVTAALTTLTALPAALEKTPSVESTLEQRLGVEPNKAVLNELYRNRDLPGKSKQDILAEEMLKQTQQGELNLPEQRPASVEVTQPVAFKPDYPAILPSETVNKVLEQKIVRSGEEAPLMQLQREQGVLKDVSLLRKSELESKPIEDYQGGQISFSADAEGGGVPSARQTAVDPTVEALRREQAVEQAKLQADALAPKQEPSSIGLEPIKLTPEEITGLNPKELDAAIEGSPIKAALDKRTGESGAVINPAELIKPAVDYFRRAGSRERVAQLLDAADNTARVGARQAANWIRSSVKNPLDRQALTFIIEANGDASRLAEFATQIGTKHPESTRAIEWAQRNWTRLQPMAQRVQAQFDVQRQKELASGINSAYVEGYVKHAYGPQGVMNRMSDTFEGIFDPGGVGLLSNAFKKERTYRTYADAIEASELLPKKLDVADLLESRFAAGKRMQNRMEWASQALGHLSDPVDHLPITTTLVHNPKTGGMTAPKGYVAKQVLPELRIAVKQEYAPVIDALTGESFLRNRPLGQAALATAATIKHGVLLFDTFHAMRVMFNHSMLTGRNPLSQKGLTLLEHNDADLMGMVRRKEIAPEMMSWAQRNRPTADLLMKNGLNVGRLAESLDTKLIEELPILKQTIAPFNKWVFEKLTRSAMMESALLEFERYKDIQPSWTDEQIAGHVAKQINIYYGNLMKQGIFKSQSARDVLQLMFLAPQWVESMAQKEVRAAGQAGKAALTAPMQRAFKVGTLAKGVGSGLLFMGIATQLLNLQTRGHFTWDNPEEDHKLDAYLPIGKGLWMSPMGVPAEITHDVLRYNASEPEDKTRVGARIMKNKLSPLARAADTFVEGENWKGERLMTTGEVLKEMGKSLAPTPIAASAAMNDQWQRALLSSVGLKTEAASLETQRSEAFQKKMGKSFEQASVKERAEFARGLEKQEKSPGARVAAMERVGVEKARTERELWENLKPGTQQWLKDNRIKLPGYSEVLQAQETPVYLTTQERKEYAKSMAEHYDQMIEKVQAKVNASTDQKKKQLLVDDFLESARAKARAELMKRINDKAKP